jgi:hypothetical protein
MAGNIQNVSFMAPGAAVLAPDIAAQEQALARRQAYVDALRQQGAEDINPNGGAISWTQGLAKMLSAYAGGRGQRAIDQKQIDLAQQLRQSMAPLFGQSGAAPAPAAGDQPSPPPQYSNPVARALVGQPPAGGPAPSLPVPQTGVSSPNPTADPALGTSETPPAFPPMAGGANAPAPAPQPAPASGGQGSLQMPGLSPQESQARYLMDPQGYMQQLQASSSPTDVMKNLAAQYGWGTPAFKQALADANFKNNYVAPVNGRPGSTMRDPRDPTKVIGYDPTSPAPGATPTFDGQGNVTGWSLPSGTTQVIAQTEGAKSAAAAANKPIAGYDANGNPVYSNELTAAHGGAGAPGGFVPGLRPGTGAFADTMGKQGGGYFAGLADSAADTNNRIYALKQMGSLINDPKANFGPGAQTWNQVFGTLKTTFGVPDPALNNAQEFNKWAAQYSARAASDLGLSGSDSRVQMAVHATPNGTMTRQALAQIVPQMVGLESAKGAMANAGARFASSNPGPNAQGAFLTQWRQAYDPRIFTAMAQGPGGVQALLKHAQPQDRAALIAKSKQLAAMGAFAQ